MRVFITGASGHLGSVIIPELIGAGHDVVGLARSDASAAAVQALGADVHRGSLDDLDSLREAASASDGVIHLAFKHDELNAGDLEGPLGADLSAIEAMGEVLAGTGKPFVGTSGTIPLAFGGVEGVGTETDILPAGPRIDAENAVIAFADRGIRSSVVRPPPLVHSQFDHTGYTPALISFARAKGKAGYPGDGSNRWPAVHSVDAGAPLPPRARRRPGRDPTARRRRRGCATAGDRRSDRKQSGCAGGQHPAGGDRRLLRLPGLLHLLGQPGVEHAHPGAAGLASDTSRDGRRPQRGPLLPELTGCRAT